MRRRPLLLLLFTFAWAAACPSTTRSAFAATPDSAVSEADHLVERALDLRMAGKDREALPLLERAAALDPSPRKRGQLALGEQAVGEWVEAERGLVSVLTAPLDPWVEQHRVPFEKALATVRAQLGWLEVDGNVAGAKVTLNGALLGALPLPDAVRVPAGVATLTVVAPGYAPVTRLVPITSGEHAREVLSLEREPVAPLPAQPGSESALPATAAPKPRAPATRGGSATWGLMVGSGVALAWGIAANTIREADAQDYNRQAAQYNAQCNPQCPAGRPSQTNVDVFTGLAIAGYGAGAALAVAAGVLLLRRNPSSAASTRAPLRCGVGLLAVGCGGEF